jgi:signal transduction histidine kinase
VLEQLLQLNRLERSGERLALARCDLARIVRDCAAELAPEALARGCELLVVAPESMPLHGDSTLLCVLVRNLIENAIRHGGQGAEVRVSLGLAMGGILLEVEDHGPGVPVAERAAVFERFRRGEGAWVAGSGLGLSIASRVVELHRGHIELADRVGGPGLVVRVSLPTDG